MIRARAEHRPARPAPWLLLLPALVLAAACQAGPTASSGVPSGTTGSPAASDTPGTSPTPAASTLPTAAGTDQPATGTPPPSPTDAPTATSLGSASRCSESDANRAFFAQAATVMAWPVYCAVLPAGWFVESGTYRLADGGRLEVTYRGPDGAHLALVEGNVCADAGADIEACAPRDAVIGSAPFGDLTGELGRLSTGLTLDVDRGASPSWRATGAGLTEEAFRALAAAFVLVEGSG